MIFRIILCLLFCYSLIFKKELLIGFYGDFIVILVIGKSVDFSSLQNPSDFGIYIESIVLPSFEILKKWEENKKVPVGLFAVQRAGALIIEAQAAEELGKMLQSLPSWGQNTYEVTPLQSIQSVMKM
jgi:hypothetical protein